MDTSGKMDPSLSESLTRKMRLKLLLDQGQQLERDLSRNNCTATLGIVSSLIEESDNIINEGEPKDRVEHTTEVVMDTHVLKLNNELIAKVMLQNMEFNEQIYQNAINNVVNKGSQPNWDAFAEIVCKVARTVNVHSTMFGAVESVLKERIVKERQQRQRTTLEAQKRPDTVSKLKRQDKGAEKMNVLHKELAKIFKSNNCRAVPFYKLVVHPKNFMNSVENAFQLAFLARDGIIGIEIGEDGHPEVRLIQSAEQKIQMDTSQWICSIDENKCAEMAKFYKIKEPMLRIETEELNDDNDDEEFEAEYLESDSD